MFAEITHPSFLAPFELVDNVKTFTRLKKKPFPTFSEPFFVERHATFKSSCTPVLHDKTRYVRYCARNCQSM